MLTMKSVPLAKPKIQTLIILTNPLWKQGNWKTLAKIPIANSLFELFIKSTAENVNKCIATNLLPL